MITISRRALTLCVAALSLAACQAKPPAADTAKDVAAIRQAEADWSNEMASKDPSKMAAHYAPDAWVTYSGAPLMQGPSDVAKVIAPMMNDPAFKLSFGPDRVVVANSGDLAYTVGRYHITLTDPKTGKPADTDGAYVTVYAKGSDGKWRASADFSTDLPAAVSPAAAKN